MRKIVRQLQRAGRLHEWRHLLPPPLASSCPQQQAQAEAPAAAAGQADSFAGASAAAAEAGAEAAGPAAGSAGSSAALAALAAVAAAARSSSPSTGALPAWPRKEGRPQGSPPASQGASKAAAPAAAGARVAAAPLPSGWEARAVAWQQLSQRQAEAWAGSLQAVSLDFLEGNWSGGQALAAAGPPPPPSRPPCSTGAAAAARNLPPAEEVAPPRTQQRVLLRPGGCDAPQQATVGQPGARLAAAGAALLPQGWQEQSVAWQQTSRHAAKRWEASVPPAVPSWLADDAQLHTMLLPDAGAQPAGPRWQQAVAPSAAGLAEPGAGVHSQRPPQQAAAAPGKLQHTAALAQPDQQPQQAQQPEGSATTACTLLQWQPAAQAACSQAAASAGAASLASPALLQPGAPLPPMATPPGSVLASLPAPAAASLQLLLARLPIERLPEVERGGGSAPPLLAHQQQQAPTAAGGDVLLYCRKTNGLAGLPLLERLLVVEARREGGPGPGSKARWAAQRVRPRHVWLAGDGNHDRVCLPRGIPACGATCTLASPMLQPCQDPLAWAAGGRASSAPSGNPATRALPPPPAASSTASASCWPRAPRRTICRHRRHCHLAPAARLRRPRWAAWRCSAVAPSSRARWRCAACGSGARWGACRHSDVSWRHRMSLLRNGAKHLLARGVQLASVGLPSMSTPDRPSDEGLLCPVVLCSRRGASGALSRIAVEEVHTPSSSEALYPGLACSLDVLAPHVRPGSHPKQDCSWPEADAEPENLVSTRLSPDARGICMLRYRWRPGHLQGNACGAWMH